MGFITNALGVNNGYNVSSGAGPNNAANTAQQATDTTTVNNAISGEGTLAQQLLAQSQGQGPNIANLQLQQATNQNNQQAAGMLASQRGMNPALAQRLISQQQATNNQNAAGQSGVLRAQQQLAAQSGLSNAYGQQATEAGANNQMLTQAQTAANSANAQIAQNNTNANAQVASGIIGGGAQMLSSILAHGGEVKSPEHHLQDLLVSAGRKIKPKKLSGGGSPASGGNPLGSLGSTSDNAIDPGLAQGQNLTGMFGQAGAGATNSGSGAMSGATSMQGQDDTLFGGSSIGNSGVSGLPGAAASSPLSGITGGGLTAIAAQGGQIPNFDLGGILKLASLFASGGQVKAQVSPGERFIPPQYVDAVKSGKVKASKVAPKFPGRAKVKGDSEKNDVIKTSLDEGGIVIPRTKADNDSDAREFLQAIQANKKKKEGPSGYAKVLEARRKRSA